MNEIEIRVLDNIADFQKAEQVQLETWGYSERDVVPSSIFSVARNFGGQAIGAFDGECMVAFALALGALDEHPHLHSHMVAVVPGYQNRGLGKRIKLAQRDDALRRGIDRICWTFDPLQVRNAHFNFTILGGVGVKYIPNLYGTTSSPLHGGMPTDRLLVEWNLESPRVLRALNNQHNEQNIDAISVPISSTSSDVPIEVRIAGQTALRERILQLMSEQYVITGLERSEGQASYILHKQGREG